MSNIKSKVFLDYNITIEKVVIVFDFHFLSMIFITNVHVNLEKKYCSTIN